MVRAIRGSQRNAYGGPTRGQYCCTHIPPCERKLKHEEHRKDRNQNSPSSPSYYEAVRQQVHTQWHSGTGTSGRMVHMRCLDDAQVTVAVPRVPAVTRTQARLTHCNLHERVPSHSSHWSWNECYHADGARTEPTQSTTFTTS